MVSLFCLYRFLFRLKPYVAFCFFTPMISSHRQMPISPMLAGMVTKLEMVILP